MNIGKTIPSIFLKKNNNEVVAIDHWWSYLASYEKGLGSTRLNLYFKNLAPITTFEKLVVTGTTYSTNRTDNLPDPDELGRLNSLNDHVVSYVCENHNAFYIGTFTHHKEQLNYFYVSSSKGVKKSIENFYYHPSENFYISVTEDPNCLCIASFYILMKKPLSFIKKSLLTLVTLLIKMYNNLLQLRSDTLCLCSTETYIRVF